MNAADDSSFDRRLRGLHAASLEALSPRVQAGLARRGRPEAVHARRPPPWAWGTALASVAVLAIALQLRQPPASVPPAPAPALAAMAVAEPPADPGAMLAEDPDFYTWLGSAESVRSED